MKPPGDSNEYAIFNISIETGQTQIINPNTKKKCDLIYGHRIILVIPLKDEAINHKMVGIF